MYAWVSVQIITQSVHEPKFQWQYRDNSNVNNLWQNNSQINTQHGELDSLVQFRAPGPQNMSGVRLSSQGSTGDNEGRLHKTASNIKIYRTQRPEIYRKEAYSSVELSTTACNHVEDRLVGVELLIFVSSVDGYIKQ